MTIENVKRFYGEMKGWNMFDTQFLTDRLSEFLDQEAVQLRRIFAANVEYDHLVEVGCGYGRYMDWAVSSAIAYDGIDIVDWMISMAEIKVQQFNERFPGVHCAVHLHPAERLSALMDSALLNKRQAKTIAFFPFNCFGNVSNVHEVMRSLYRDRLDVVISTFLTDAKSTELRKQYYQNCGYSNLECTLNKHGLLITSDEGFRAFAYSKEALVDMFARNGYELASYSDVAEIGAMYHFRPVSNKDEAKTDSQRQGARRYPRYDASLDATLYVLNDNEARTSDAARLLSFSVADAVTKDVSADGVAVVCATPWKAGVRARIDLPVGGESGARLGFIGVLTRCEPLDDGLYLLAFKFFKPASALIEHLFSILDSKRLAG